MKIKNFRDVFIAGNNYEELKEKKISLSDLLAYPILMLDKNSTTNEFLHRLFQQHQLDLVPEIELTSNDLLIDLHASDSELHLFLITVSPKNLTVSSPWI